MASSLVLKGASAVAAVLVAAYFVVPSLVVLWISFTSGGELTFPLPGYSLRWYEAFLESSRWTRAATTSIVVAVAVTVLATLLGTPLALALVRGRLPGKRWIVWVLLAPVVVPGVVIGLGLYMVALRLNAVGTYAALVLAHTALCLPFVVLNVAASLRAGGSTLELAAQSCGASPARAFMTVTLRAIAPGVLAGALLSFVTSWDETVVASFLSNSRLQTMPVLIWIQMSRDLDPTIAAAASIITGLTFVVVTVAGMAALLRRGARS